LVVSGYDLATYVERFVAKMRDDAERHWQWTGRFNRYIRRLFLEGRLDDTRTATSSIVRMRAKAPPGDNANTRIADYLAQLGPDELEVMLLVAEGLARGRAVYGELRADRDPRDFRTEAGAELRDCLVYVAAELLRLRHTKGSQSLASRG
jgi:hypothetical protein